jgi:serine/threonine protein kinase
MATATPRKSISHYWLDGLLGLGSMGIVCRGYDTELKRWVAVKLLAPNRLDTASRRRFRKEGRLLSLLHHPNIATVYEFGEEDGVDYLVMELVSGITVQERLKTGPLPAAEVTRLGAQLARGLAEAHASGIVHRDIKPSNLCLTRDGLIKILDFGIATGPPRLSPTATTRTDGALLTDFAGTLGYMAPELLHGLPADARTDIFSVGVVLYEMLCGQRPYAAEQPIRSLELMLLRQLVRPRQIVPTVPRALERIILTALESDPDRRWQSAAELATGLERLSEPAALCSQGWFSRALAFARQRGRMMPRDCSPRSPGDWT